MKYKLFILSAVCAAFVGCETRYAPPPEDMVEKPPDKLEFKVGDRVSVSTGQWGTPHVATGVFLEYSGFTSAVVLFIDSVGTPTKLIVPAEILKRL